MRDLDTHFVENYSLVLLAYYFFLRTLIGEFIVRSNQQEKTVKKGH